MKISLMKIFFSVFWSKKSIKISCSIFELFTIASVPLVGELYSLISGMLCVILLFKIDSSFLVVVSACSSMSLESLS